MQTKFEYYYNNVPNKGKCRNNLVYTSLISSDKKIFCQWYYNDKDYHGEQNKVVDLDLMEEKWSREVNFLLKMHKTYPQHLLEIIDIDYRNKKIYFSINNVDFWELSNCDNKNYSKVLPDWQDQMLEIIQSHRDLKMYKFSMHPSSYFVVDGKLKSINYFFSYDFTEPDLTMKELFSHISSDRLEKLFPLMEKMNIDWSIPEPLEKIQMLAFESFKYNFPSKVMEKARDIYV